jgi:hypothetical protein
MFFGRLVRDSYNCSAEISRSAAASVYQQKRRMQLLHAGAPGMTDTLFRVDSKGGGGDTSLA